MSARLRNGLSALLIALSCLLVPLGALAAWAAYGLADTGRYVTALAPLSTDPDVRDAVADTVGTRLLREAGAGRPLPDAVRPFVRDAARSFTRTEAFRAGWDAANRAVHDAVLRRLRDERAAGGPVTVDLAPVTARVKDRLARDHVPLARRIPVEHTAIAVLPARDAERLRTGYRVLEVAARWLPAATVVFAAAGIAVAACRRRAVAAAGLGTALGGALLALAVAVGRRLTLADLAGEIGRPAAGAVYDALTATLRTVSWLLVVLGLAVALLSWLTARPGPFAHRRRPGSPDPGSRPARARP
ncbi:hypothetical protein [Streptomyces glaucus]|uniref:Integral membrane protein n=1 Tax=Streptomyces glaucus TaxID=284029 RepID=A0ABN3K1C4_9ACTN